MKKLYQKREVIKNLFKYFKPYINLLTKPSGQKLFLLILAIISMQFITSIRYIYKVNVKFCTPIKVFFNLL